MREILKDKIFWMLSIALAGIVFVTATNSNYAYQAEVEILFLPKNEAVASSTDQVLGNAEHLATLLSFYDRILSDNGDIEDEAVELSATERKKFWNDVIATEQIEGSGILKIIVVKDSQSQAGMIARQSAETLIGVMSRLYDIRTELDMRIVDGPAIDQVKKISTILWLVMSLFFGMLAGLIINTAIEFGVKRLSAKKAERRLDFPKMKPSIFPRVYLPENFVKKEISPEAKDVFDFKAEKKEALAVSKNVPAFLPREKKSAAPENLPIAENFNFDVVEEENVPVQKIESEKEEKLSFEKLAETVFSEEPKKDLSREATPDEVKARLNKLLGGDMLK